MMKKATQFVLLLLAIISTVIAGRVAYLLWNESSLESVLAHSRATGTQAFVEPTPTPQPASNPVILTAVGIVESKRSADYSLPSPLPALPDEITTGDNKTYKGVILQKVEPDGLLVKYMPSGGGIGVAKLKFENLPPVIQKVYVYDPALAKAYETEQQRGVGRWRAQFLAEEARGEAKQTAIQSALAQSRTLTAQTSLAAARSQVFQNNQKWSAAPTYDWFESYRTQGAMNDLSWQMNHLSSDIRWGQMRLEWDLQDLKSEREREMRNLKWRYR